MGNLNASVKVSDLNVKATVVATQTMEKEPQTSGVFIEYIRSFLTTVNRTAVEETPEEALQEAIEIIDANIINIQYLMDNGVKETHEGSHKLAKEKFEELQAYVKSNIL
jgi:hypothetical protein